VLAGVLLVSALLASADARLTHSIAQIKGATAEIAEGRFDVGLKVQRKDEPGHMTSINRIASKLRHSRRTKEVPGDVAHN
jgi:HAMP domain-containing protein